MTPVSDFGNRGLTLKNNKAITEYESSGCGEIFEVKRAFSERAKR